jgi:pyridoxal phosphate enzyme (YggS family)
MSEQPSSIQGNLVAIRERIEKAATRAGRRVEDVTLVAVSKTIPAERIQEAYSAGVRHFGESRTQEWETKAPHLAGLDATWHLVGHLQRNKAAHALTLFHEIDSLDTLPLAEKLERGATDGRRLPVLIEVRLDAKGKKAGCDPGELPRLAEGLLLMPHLELRGLMTVPPQVKDVAEARPYFRQLRELRDSLAAQVKIPLPELSMGMSRDFEIAIEEGATQIRVGTAVFGERPLDR